MNSILLVLGLGVLLLMAYVIQAGLAVDIKEIVHENKLETTHRHPGHIAFDWYLKYCLSLIYMAA